ISAPPIVDSCPYGMDFQDKSQLIAYNKSIEDICEGINSDRLIYVDPKGLDVLSKETYGCGTCSGCFGGRYPFPNEDTSS
ncbi:MAG TPA: amidophosphoribosyltransferase, partial [Myxococcales bacterium]|nr:amidophosphoribosyltransferase [Myxococcales bacterium]